MQPEKLNSTSGQGASARLLAGLSAAAFCGPVLAGGDFSARMDEVLDRWTADGRIIGAVALVARDGELVYRSATGLADREAGRAVTEDTLFRLASMTKPIVTATALALAEEERLSLDDRVSHWLPWFTPEAPDGSRPGITVRQLMTHTSGLCYSFLRPESTAYAEVGFDEGLAGSGLSLEENLRRLASAPLFFEPGTEWCYSPSTDVLGAVVEAASGLSLPAAVRTYVTGPLGMTDTVFWTDDVDRLAVPYRDGSGAAVRMEGPDAYVPFEKPIRVSPARATDPDAFPSGGGGMIGTAADYLRFLEAIRTGGSPILGAESVGLMTTHAIGDLRAWTEGEGWGHSHAAAVLLDPVAARSPQSVGTWSWGGALGAHWFVDPAERLTVVVLTNTSLAGVIGDFPIEVRDAVYARPES